MIKVKLISALTLTVALMLALIACGGNKDFVLIKDITSEHILKISVSTMPTLFDTVELTDADEIQCITQYLEGLNPSRSSTDDTVYGMAYLINIFYDDSTETKVVLSGNKNIRINDNATHTIPYDEATVFDTVIGNILLNQYHNEYEGAIIKGMILSVSSDVSGSSIACEVKAENDTVISINLNSTKHIIDITGSGWLILHIGDEVEIGVNENFIADKVFITKTAE